MHFEKIENQKIHECYYRLVHPTGLPIYVVPKEGFSETYAIIATDYGSVNSAFETKDGRTVAVPDGTAHFLEHKLFESEEGNAFDLYAKTGASANAFTSFDMTAYLFSCTDQFEQSLEILLDLVQNPYFTAQTVQKEQGIIGQEIRMYEDDPSWRSLFNLLGAVYHDNPVKKDIAGTVDTIAEITDQKLYECYENFYDLSNMVLCVCGNVTPDQVLAVADRKLKPAKGNTGKTVYPAEAPGVREQRVEQKMSVSVPMYCIGLKDDGTGVMGEKYAEKELLFELCLELLCGENSDFYKDLYREGVINSSFDKEYNGSTNFSLCVLSGQGNHPDLVYEKLCTYMERLSKGGIQQEAYENCVKSLYGRRVSAYNTIEGIAHRLISCYFRKVEPFQPLESFQNLNRAKVQEFYDRHFRRELTALSVILPATKD